MPLLVVWPSGKFPERTHSRTASVHCQRPLCLPSGSIHWPITCSVKLANTTQSNLQASFNILHGRQGFPALTVIISICDHKKGDCQLVWHDFHWDVFTFNPEISCLPSGLLGIVNVGMTAQGYLELYWMTQFHSHREMSNWGWSD